MCGRFVRITPVRVIADLFDCPTPEEQPPRYNIAPTQSVAVVRRVDEQAGREMAWLRWGLIPFWAKDKAIGNRMINARSETAATNGAFRNAFRRRRCLIPTDGFYEWMKVEGQKKKQPMFIARRDAQPFALAGLWEQWTPPEGDRIESFTILTTSANDLIRPIHDRMPVILAGADYEQWLDPKPADPGGLQELLQPFPDQEMATRPVGTLVNNARFDDPKCLEAV